MIDKILKKYADQAADQSGERARPEDIEVTDDLGSFGWMRGVRDRAVMLELRKKDGNIMAIGYAWLEKIEFDPSDGITLHTAGHPIKIRGRNLNTDLGNNVRLFEAMTRHRVSWIQEMGKTAAFKALKGATMVEEIE
jgi:hypothetical protein